MQSLRQQGVNVRQGRGSSSSRQGQVLWVRLVTVTAVLMLVLLRAVKKNTCQLMWICQHAGAVAAAAVESGPGPAAWAQRPPQQEQQQLVALVLRRQQQQQGRLVLTLTKMQWRVWWQRVPTCWTQAAAEAAGAAAVSDGGRQRLGGSARSARSSWTLPVLIPSLLLWVTL
jgi:hypothetical protein